MKFIFPLFAFLFVFGCAEPDPTLNWDAADYFAHAKVEYKVKNYDSATVLIQHAIGLDSIPFEYHELLGEILWDAGDTLHANEQFEYIIVNAVSPEAAHDEIKHLIEWELASHNTEEVEKYLERDLAIHKDDTANYFRIINYAQSVYISIGETEKAVELIKSALKEHPKTYDYHKLLGDISYGQKEYKNARHAYEKYVKHITDDRDVFYCLGICYLEGKSKSKAKKYFKKAADLGHKEACQNYREMSAKTRYSITSRCCDGSESYSTGRGTCSHHGGVCGTIRTPYKEYTVSCN